MFRNVGAAKLDIDPIELFDSTPSIADPVEPISMSSQNTNRLSQAFEPIMGFSQPPAMSSTPSDVVTARTTASQSHPAYSQDESTSQPLEIDKAALEDQLQRERLQSFVPRTPAPFPVLGKRVSSGGHPTAA